MPRIDQFVPSFARHDAIGNHVLQLRTLIRGAGFGSEIFYEHLDPRLAGEARPFRECDPTPDPGRLILYHASTHTEMTGWLAGAAGAGQAIVVDYHNITPARYFSVWEPLAARSMEAGRAQLAALVPLVTAALADSEYNASELTAMGVSGTRACPILLDLDEYHQAPDPAPASRLGEGPLWLFVGRIAPNKCQHDVIAAFAAYRRLYAPGSKLALIGAATSGRYQKALEDMVDDLGLAGAVDMPGSTPFSQMLGYFHRADVFACMSEHEGFCVPVIEAMELGVPVVAYAAAAVTETVAGAGVLLQDKDPVAVAASVHALLSDPTRRAALVEAGRARAQDFSRAVTSARWMAELRSISERVAGASSTDNGRNT